MAGSPVGLRFFLGAEDVSRLTWMGDEATSAQLAGADGGRALAVAALTLISPGASDQALRALGDATYARIDASLVGATGPWTAISATPLAAPGPAGTAINVWVRAVVLGAIGTAMPFPVFSLRLRSARAAGWIS